MNRPHLIMGHTARDRARIWVRSSSESPVAFLVYHVENNLERQEATLSLKARQGY